MNDPSVTWWDDEYYVTLATKPAVSSLPDAPSLGVELLSDVKINGGIRPTIMLPLQYQNVCSMCQRDLM